MGATILAVLIIGLWGYTAYRTFPIASSASSLLIPFSENCPSCHFCFFVPVCEIALTVDELQLLIGISADPKFLQQVTYITLTHDQRILQIDTCRAYHSGPVPSPYPCISFLFVVASVLVLSPRVLCMGTMRFLHFLATMLFCVCNCFL